MMMKTTNLALLIVAAMVSTLASADNSDRRYPWIWDVRDQNPDDPFAKDTLTIIHELVSPFPSEETWVHNSTLPDTH